MKVHIQLTAWFKKYTNGKSEICVELEKAGTTVTETVGIDVGLRTGTGTEADSRTSASASSSSKIGFTARDAIIAAGIPENEVGVITKDGYKITEDLCLNDGDKIKIFTTILGG